MPCAELPLPGQRDAERDGHQQDAAGRAVLREQAVGNAGVPDHHHVEEGGDGEARAFLRAVGADHPAFVRLVEDQGNERAGNTYERIAPPEGESAEQTAG